ncbi:MAG: hypothetical protein IJJ25_03550 [Lachnospiraceae bacterium]|nr:hypothetical protein [Lachnospiraceae bacterium]
MKENVRKGILYNTAVIALCFLLTSTGYLAWVYNLAKMVSPQTADALTMVAGYLFQAAGVGLFAFIVQRGSFQAERYMYTALILYILFLFPSILAHSLTLAAVSGMFMNLLCGFIAGYYLMKLMTGTPAGVRGVVFGAGYCLSILGSWVLSLIDKGSVYYSNSILVICVIIAAAVIAVIRAGSKEHDNTGMEESAVLRIPEGTDIKTFLITAGLLVLLFSIVNSCGFGFPTADVVAGISLEFSRLFYAAGLLIAGLVCDKGRKYCAVSALTALVIPFIMLALKGEPVSATVLWALSYFAFGFYSVYRIILFSDIAESRGNAALSGAGLLIGRVGDAAAILLSLALAQHFMLLLAVSAVLFIAAVILFLKIYQILYIEKYVYQASESEIFNRFSAQYDLSAREREVLRMLLSEKTNTEIAEELSISEGTVKYHIHNLLQKTGCRNRIALLSAYAGNQNM